MDGWMNQAYSRLSNTHGHITDCKLVCRYWTRLVLVRPAASLYSASPLKHHPMGKQWCPNSDHYSDSEPARQSLTLLCWALSRAAEPQILTSFVWRGRGLPGIDEREQSLVLYYWGTNWNESEGRAHHLLSGAGHIDQSLGAMPLMEG